MPRYFFNAIGDQRLRDIHGIEISTAELAFAYADRLKAGLDRREGGLGLFRVEITDEEGKVVPRSPEIEGPPPVLAQDAGFLRSRD